MNMVQRNLLNEMHARQNCMYCNESLKGNEWNSIFELEFHYKTTNCESCGKQNFVKVDFHGSGHDNWDGISNWKFHYKENNKNLDLKIKEIKKFEELGRVDQFRK